MKALYLECAMGAAGDMLTAALYELLPDPSGFVETLNRLPLPGVTFRPERKETQGITGTHMSVLVAGQEEDDHHHTHHHHDHSTLPDIYALVDTFPLPEPVLTRVRAVYARIAQAEAQVHGQPVDLVHFHEVGALDAVADVTAACYAMHLLDVQKVAVSPVHTGFGTVQCAHGRMPVPAPATALLLTGALTCSGDIEGELCTPTGAALITEFATEYGRQPPMRLQKVGVGVGKKSFSAPNCLRAFLGEDGGTEEISELVCNIDDMTPEALSFACRRLLDAGALDVYTLPGVMKKGRPGHLLTVLCPPAEEQAMAQRILRETTTQGLRIRRCEKIFLTPRSESLDTPWGPVRVKIAEGWGISHRKPEFAEAARIAAEQNLPICEVLAAISRLSEET